MTTNKLKTIDTQKTKTVDVAPTTITTCDSCGAENVPCYAYGIFTACAKCDDEIQTAPCNNPSF